MIKHSREEYVELDSKNGNIFGFDLFKDPNIDISRFFLSSGAIFDNHKHENSIEFMFIYEGELVFMLDEKPFNLKKFDSIFIPVGVPHYGCAKQNTWLVNILSPPEKIFKSAT